MADIVPNLPSLTAGNRARDAEGIISDIEMLIDAITPEWTDRSDSDPGVALLQTVAYLLDHAHYQVDRALTDAVLTRTTRKSAAVHQARAIGYVADGPAAATCILQFTLLNVDANDTTILLGAEVSGSYNGQTIRFQTTENYVIAAGDLTTTTGVAARHQFAGTETLSESSNGEPFQKYTLGSTSVLHNRTQKTLIIKVDNESWTEVASFANSKIADEHYVVLKDHLNRLTVLFGDSERGRIPAVGSVLTASYSEGGGPSGNVPIGTLTTVVTTSAGTGFLCTNLTPGVGGKSTESLDSIRVGAPPFFAAQGRAVTSEDYNAILASVSGLLRAQAFKVGINSVECRVVPAGWSGEVLGDNDPIMVNTVSTIKAKRMVTDVAIVRTATPVRPTTHIRVHVQAGVGQNTTRTAVLASLATLYDLDSLAFGGRTSSTNLFFSDMVAAVDNTEGVSHVDVLKFTRRCQLTGPGTNGWDLASGDAALGAVSVNEGTEVETWTIKFLTATTFRVDGSASGFQGTGTVAAEFTSANGAITFTVTAGVTDMQGGNEGRFKTSPIIGNVPVDELEHPVFVATPAPAGDLTMELVGGVGG